MAVDEESDGPVNYGRIRWLVIPLVALAVMSDGFDIQLLGYILPELLKDWGTTKLALAPVLSMGLLGLIVASFWLPSWAIVSDERKCLLLRYPYSAR